MMVRRGVKQSPQLLIRLALALAATFSAGAAWADPPGRIARLSYFSGAVSFSPAGDDQWASAVVNRPVITGDRLWSDNGARVELTLDNGALWLGAATNVVVSNIDDRTAQFELQQGTLDLRVRRAAGANVVEIDTPNLAFQVSSPGRFHIVVDPQSATTTVVVRDGTAEVYGEGASYVVARGQAYRFYGTDLRNSEYFAPGEAEESERFALERDSRFDRVVSSRYVSPDVVGYEDLDRYGAWRPVESYGNVWFPQEVPGDWAPYRQGHWSWIDPWGWTWVDDAPWGFAPYHYGRWAYVQDRWGWVPGPVSVRPVYAPALVVFIGGANFSVSVSSGPAIGWFPLAPREVYRPAYNVSREYYRQVNVSNTVINNTVINNTYVSNVTTTTAPVTQQVNYVNLRAPNAVTAVPPAAFAQSQPITRANLPMPSAVLDKAQIQSMAKIAPTRTAFTGGAPPAQAKPPATVQQQAVVAKSPPPPAPVPLAQKLLALERNPGKPLDRVEFQANSAAGPVAAPAQNVKLVNPDEPTTAAPPPAVRGDALRARPSAPSAAPAAAAPAATKLGTAEIPAPTGESRGQPPTAPTPSAPGASNRQAAPPGAPAPTVPQPMPSAADRPPAGVAPPGAPQPPRGDSVKLPLPPRAPTPGGEPGPRPPEPRAVPQEQSRPAPQATAPAPRPPEPRAVPQEQSHPAPQATAPASHPPESRAIPQEQSHPAPQATAPASRPPESRAVPQEQSHPAPQATPSAPRPPEPAVLPEKRPTPQAQPQRSPDARPAAPPPQARPPSDAQPGPAPPKPELVPDNKRDDTKEKGKDTQN
jgi:hypothetical protein